MNIVLQAPSTTRAFHPRNNDHLSPRRSRLSGAGFPEGPSRRSTLPSSAPRAAKSSTDQTTNKTPTKIPQKSKTEATESTGSEGSPSGTDKDFVWTSLQGLFLISIFFPPTFLLPPFIPAEISSIEALTPVWGVLGAFSLLLGGVSFLELGSSFNVLPTPVEDSTLKTSGAYQFVRHPMYSSQILFLFCFAMLSGSTTRLILTGLLGVVFEFKAGIEEGYLVERYGKEYEEYQKSVKKLLPFIY